MSPATAAAILTDDLTVLEQYATSRDPRAFELLVHRYQAMVLATCRRVVGQQIDAEDATQETFLKLAQNAGRIRSNAAAWLHACALRTSIDLLRRRGSQGRVERAVGAELDASVAQPEDPTWSEIKPLLDRALSQLDETDRDLIVNRFLVGRSEAEMAREAGVNPGTMNRRIDRALERLRLKLRAAGLVVAGVATLGAALGHGLGGPVTPALTSAIMEVGLSGLATATVAGGLSLGVKLTAAALASVVGVASIGGLAYLGGGNPVGLVLGTTASAASADHSRPTKAQTGLKVTSMLVDGHRESYAVSDGREFTLRANPPRGSPIEVKLRIDSAEGSGNQINGKFTILAADGFPKDEGMFKDVVGKSCDGVVDIDDDLMKIHIMPPADPATGKPPPNSLFLGWGGFRVAAKQIPPAADAPIPQLAGEWTQGSDFNLTVDAQDISLTDGDFVAMRYRVLDWEAGPNYAKVQTICSRHYDGARVGERTKLLVRRDPNGWTFAVYDGTDRTKLNEWPSGFEPKKGEWIRVISFKEGKK
jgi:RNA polymerase sigma factor (sigma-70 family)